MGDGRKSQWGGHNINWRVGSGSMDEINVSFLWWHVPNPENVYYFVESGSRFGSGAACETDYFVFGVGGDCLYVWQALLIFPIAITFTAR